MKKPPLFEYMAQETLRRQEALLEEARREADGVRAKARSRAGEQRQEALAQLALELAESSRHVRERAQSDTYMVLLTARDTVAEEVLKAAEAALKAIPEEPRFETLLRRLLDEVMRSAPPDVVVLVPPPFVDQCREWLKESGRPYLRVEARSGLRDGVAIQDEARSYRVTNTLSQRFARQKSVLRKRALQQLFPAEEGG